MSYCANCGGRLNDNGQCPNCGGVSEAKIAPEVKETSDVLGCLKALLSESPLSAIERAARSRSASVWVTFGALYLITTIIAQMSMFTSLPPEALRGVLDKGTVQMMAEAGNGAPLPEHMMPAFTEIFAFSVGMSLVTIAVITLMTAMIFVLAEERPTFTQALNISTFATLPLSVCSLIALPVSLISAALGAGILLIGFAAGVIMYYFGLQKASEFKRSPFWLFILMVFVGELVIALFSLIFSTLIF